MNNLSSINSNKAKVIAILFIISIFTSGILTGIFGAKEIGYKMLIGYKENLPENSSILDHVKGIIDSVENGLTTSFYYKNSLINLFGIASKTMNMRIINDVSDSNTIYKLDNEQITFINPHNNVNFQASNIIKLNTSLASMDIPLVYVQAPFKINKFDNQLPYEVEDYTNINADIFLKEIQSGGVKSLDLREQIKNEGLNYDTLFFNTDHHWKPETGLWSSRVIAEMLKEEFGFRIDESHYHLNRYSITPYKDLFLGSQGKRVGSAYAGVDDIHLLTPKFDTYFNYYLPHDNLVRTGDFSEVMLFLENLDRTDYFNSDPYSVYTGGNYPLKIIKNKNSHNDKKVLLVSDSFSLVVTPFLSLAAKELHTIDLRYFKDTSLFEYVKEVQPSIVIILYNPGALVDNNSLFEFD
jgi:hypothetical protein